MFIVRGLLFDSHNQFSGEQHAVPSHMSIVDSHNQISGEQWMAWFKMPKPYTTQL